MSFVRVLVLVLVAFASTGLGLAQTKVHIYLRAFIPKDHPANPGYVRPVPTKPNLFVIPNPHFSLTSLQTWLCTPSVPGDDTCFSSDNRDFSSDLNVTSRALTEFVLVISGSSVTVEKAAGREFHRTDMTHKVSCQTGADLVPPKAGSTSNMHFGTPAMADGIIQIVVDGRAANPLAPVPEAVSPDVQYGGTFTYDTQKNTLRFQGSTKIFPAYEAYAQLNDGPIVTLFTISPDQNTSVCDLIDPGLGLKLKSVDQMVTLQDSLTGKWETTDGDKRFLFSITGTAVQWTERGTTNTTPGVVFTSGTTITFVDGKFRIERPNDNAALTFLGYKPQSLRDAILSRNPKPSFIVFTRKGNALSAEWNGLVVTKNPDGTLREVIHPGVRPPKAFTFDRVP